MLQLKELRADHEMSQQNLADALGVSRSTVAMWEKGASQPSHEMLIRISDIFDVSVDYLLGKEKKTPAQSERMQELERELEQERIRFALYRDRNQDPFSDLTEEELEDVKRFVDFLKSKRK